MPYFHFESESELPMTKRHKVLIFCAVCVAHGVWIHPFHTNFLRSRPAFMSKTHEGGWFGVFEMWKFFSGLVIKGF